MELVSTVLGPILERVVKPVLNEIGYVFTYSCNVKNFTNKVERMKVMRDGVKERVSVEEDNLQVIAPNVNAWLVRADHITQVEERIMNKKPGIEKGWCKGWCPNIKLRYTLSKKAKKSTEDVVELLVEGTAYLNFSRPAPSLQVEFIGNRQYVEFKSRKSNEDEIIEALMNDKINLVGICGMGGVGKTMMAKKVGKKVKEEAMFDEVVMVSVGPKLDLKKIQEGIAEALGFQLKEDSLIVRANKLQRRLALRKTLLILDDVWARLDLEELGISFAISKECKILLTSRHRDTCVQMEAQKTVVIEVLKEDEGWGLFKERAGGCVNEPGINRVAQDVSRECCHLPLALTTVGRALRDKTQHSWEDAREQLRKSAPSNLPEVLKEVYQPLELSYNLLESEEAQSLFLICSLFPEDYCIPLDFLIWYGLGLRVLKNVNGLEEARKRVSRLVEMLEDRFLLDDAGEGSEKFSMVNYEKHVKMHHILRDVAIYIANKEDDVLISTHEIEWPEEMPYERLTCISIVSDALTVLPESLKCPHLNVLRLQCNNATLRMPEDFFHGTPSLLVLDMPGSFICALPPSLECLKNLRVLYLRSQHVEDISVIGELKQLEMLICFCSAKTLPAKIGSLTNLRVLNMGDTCIQKIAPGVFTQLARLEEVYLINNNCVEGSFLREISNLRHLTCLNIQILEASLLQTNISFQSLRRYFVLSSSYFLGEGHLHKAMHLSLPSMSPLSNWVRVMLREAEDLYLDENGSKVAIDVLGIERFQNVKKLILQYCSNVVFLANTEDSASSSQCVFPILESLSLLHLNNFLKICNGPFLEGSLEKLNHLRVIALPKLITLLEDSSQRVSLRNLQTVTIDACPRMSSLFSLATARGLVKLRDLDICNCVAMEEVFLNERNEMSFVRQKLTFPKLNHLKLENLPNLACFCHGVEDIEFPQLMHLEITNAPKFTSFCPPQSHDDLEGLSLFDYQVKFGSLKRMTLKILDGVKEIWSSCAFTKLEILSIECCDNLKWLFCPSVAHTFVNLKEMDIAQCHKLEEVISNDQVKVGNKPVFPKLEKLKISQLPELRVFWQAEHAIELPLLKHLEINQCPKLKSFTRGPLRTQSLNLLLVNGTTFDGDINVALLQHHSS